MPPQPLALDDDQLADLLRLAGPIPTESRDEFLRAVADQLRDAEIGPGTLYRAALKVKLQREMDKAGLVPLPKSPPPGVLQPGTRVRVHSGPLRGHLGIYAGMTAEDRILVLLRLLGVTWCWS